MTKRFVVCAALMASAAGCVYGQQRTESSQWTDDSLAYDKALDELTVKAVRAPKDAPFAVSNVDYKTLQTFSRTGQELPFLFARTPGVVAWSENGLGTGTTYMRIRGAAGSRINVTLDGVSLNSPEDQSVFWANMNSYASLLSSVQIQRGVGTSTNGDGAFGGTVALQTKSPNPSPSLELTVSGGSYNTWNFGGSFSSGMLKDHLIFDGAYHGTRTDGFIHGTDGKSGSYYGGLTYINNVGTLKLSYKNIGNYEQTGQAWNGVCPGDGEYSMNSYDGVKTYKDLYKMGLGRYNDLYESFTPDWAGGWTIGRHQLKDGSLFPGATDNFWQNHNLLNLSWRIDSRWTTSGTLHYTRGHGYYDDFRLQNKPKKFGVPETLSDGSTLGKADYIRRKGLVQDCYGMVWNVNYKDDKWDVIGGASMQNFEANHYGYLLYTSNNQLEADLFTDKGRYHYYDNDASKADGQIFVKGMYHITKSWDAFADVQYRHVGFMTNGDHDSFYRLPDGTYSANLMNIKHQYDFVNPKAGISFHQNGHSAYLSYAMSHREPERNNFTDNGSYPAPKAESLHDVEAGYEFAGHGWHVGAGLYAMLYHNQFVQTGLKSDLGENLTTNVKESNRLGLELSAGAAVTKWFSLEANAALSRNRITNFDEMVETYDGSWNELAPTAVHYDNSTLAFSPSAVLNGFADFHVGAFSATWHTGYVSRQYLDNTENRDRSLPAFTRTDIHLSYDWSVAPRGLKHLLFGLDFGNIFNARYASSGWVYSAIVGNTYPETNRYYQIGYVPMSGFTIMGNVTLRF
ncbi:MAG: TonB-dependent receptor plug domain-containing protein [Bacteroidaceae bacterium]|nr:TonB-dependent receptor plug domain-containing protein [Bacteroidaceae bacterium]